MERYIGTKIILAESMDEVTFKGAGASNRQGYKVQYENGYISWSPKEVFERAYRLITDAELELLK